MLGTYDDPIDILDTVSRNHYRDKDENDGYLETPTRTLLLNPRAGIYTLTEPLK